MSLQPVAASLPDDFVLPQAVCLHPNIAVTYGITTTQSGPTLVMERVETSLSNLLSEVGDKVTVRERVDLAFGILSAVDYLHNQLTVVHGYLDIQHVFFTTSLTAKVLDPTAASLMTDDRTLLTSCLTATDDMRQLGKILTALFEGLQFSPWTAAKSLQAVVALLLDGRSRCFLSDVRAMLDRLRGTAEYVYCNPKRHVLCETDVQ